MTNPFESIFDFQIIQIVVCVFFIKFNRHTERTCHHLNLEIALGILAQWLICIAWVL